MNCETIKESIWLRGTGDLNLNEENLLEDHLKSCLTCSKEAEFQESLLQRLPLPPQQPAAYWETYTQKILDRLEDRGRARPAWIWRWAATGALGLIMVAGTVLYKTQEMRETEEVIANLDLLENLSLLAKEDFEQWTVQ